ncbi:MAG: hypothetical protein K9N23_05985 [Akkermansiaceae bacterium]|nr:hypothetical protein [Akkermansiaceae bacterium]MCF7731214.1 hypothetical protein [Akkermansiaceae bacterium]
MSQQDLEPGVGKCLAALLAVAEALPRRVDLTAETAAVEATVWRGYFLPDEDELVRRGYLARSEWLVFWRRGGGGYLATQAR